MTKKISVIVPIYADWKSISQCISSLKKYYSNMKWLEVYLVNDVGPQADFIEKKIIQSIKGLTNFHYYRNEQNLGFVKNCNNAVKNLVKNNGADILLLNSDTIVTDGAFEEMIRVLYSQKDIGIVNPRSNNATVWSVPMDGRFHLNPRRSYSFWKQLKKQIPEKYICPTAHGFCMLIRREIIEDLGLFDEIYGKGYGEENDFTMRARANGWKCACANYSFVMHIGSKSFGDDTRLKLSERNSKILLERYPEYNSLIQDYISTTKEPTVIRKSSVLLKTSHILAKAVEYGHYNGYYSMIKKGGKTLNSRYRLTGRNMGEPKVHVWSHQISYTGAPMVLFDVLRQWNKAGMPNNVDYYVPDGSVIDKKLHEELIKEGFYFKQANSVSVKFHAGDVVILNSSAYPKWLYEKIITQLELGNLKHFYLYVHEDDDEMIGAMREFCNDIRKYINDGKVTIYAPSRNSTKNWERFFDVKMGIYTMPGHITYSEGMFKPRKNEDFNKINFIVAGSSEPHKGQLSVVYAFISFYNQYYKKNVNKYRDFTLTIAGIKKETNKYYTSFIINAGKSLRGKLRLVYEPNQSKMHQVMAECNLTITYSIKDSFSIVTMEGMAYGHPIIRSESSGRDEQLTKNNGWGVNTDEWEKLVEIIEEILNLDKTTNQELLRKSSSSIKIAKDNQTAKYTIISDISRILKS